MLQNLWTEAMDRVYEDILWTKFMDQAWKGRFLNLQFSIRKDDFLTYRLPLERKISQPINGH